MRVLAISGSLRRDSHNTRLLRAAAELAAAARRAGAVRGAEGRARPTTRTTTATSAPRACGACATRSPRPTRVLIATPGIQLVDPRPAQERARLGVAPVPGQRRFATSRSRSSAPAPACSARSGPRPRLRKVLGATGARVVDFELPVAGAEEAFAGDRLADEQVHERLVQILTELVEAVEHRHLVAA